jgi:hypothetical protein
LSADQSIVIAAPTAVGATVLTPVQIAALFTDSATAINHVYVAVNATNIGTIWQVADAAGTAAGNIVATSAGTIDLADTAWSTLDTAWSTLTAANFSGYTGALPTGTTTVTPTVPVVPAPVVPVVPPAAIPTATLSSNAVAVNEGSPVTYTATLNTAAATALSIPYTLGGTATAADYTTASTGTIDIAAGALTGTLVLTTVADALTEGAESVSVALGAIAGATVNTAAVLTIINDTSLTGGKVATPIATGLSTNVVGDNAVAENFTFDVGTARLTPDNTQRTITNFEATAGKDTLTFDLPTAAAATTLAAFLGLGTQGVTATVVQIGSGAGTLVNFGADANGDLVTILLSGVLTPADVVVNII